MQNIICPVSSDKVASHLPRVTAFFVVSAILAYSVTSSLSILALIAFDFILRATNNGKYSPFFQLSLLASKILKLKSDSISKAPKVFAARLGAIMFVAAIIFHLAGLGTTALIISLLVGVLATLEFAFNYCVGCIIYHVLVFPFFAKE